MSLDAQLLTRRWPERRPTVLAAAVSAFVAVAVAHRANDDPALALGLLYVLPVMLVALELGVAGGCVAAGLAIALVAAVGGESLDALGVATRSVAFVAVGAIAGWFSDRMSAAHAREERLLGSGLELGEIGSDRALPRTVAAAALRAPRVHGATVRVDGGPAAETGRMDGRRTTVSIRARGEIVGRDRRRARGPSRARGPGGAGVLAAPGGLRG